MQGAIKNDSFSQYKVAHYLHHGKHGVTNYEEAIEWYKKAIQNGEENIEVKLAQCRMASALEVYVKLAKQGNVEAIEV